MTSRNPATDFAHPSTPAGRDNATRDTLPSYNISKRPQGFFFGWRLILLGSCLHLLIRELERPCTYRIVGLNILMVCIPISVGLSSSIERRR